VYPTEGADRERRDPAVVAGVGPSPLLAAYGASKHAVVGLMRSAAREAVACGVRVNAVCPGPVESDMMQRIDASFTQRYPERRGGQPNAAASLQMGRYATPHEVAQTIAFLCSDASIYCRGGTFMVDGGYSAR
jgi:NAD(P)-dependent dehydrogenase (short-subunit alcohol dehydrogenase family)